MEKQQLFLSGVLIVGGLILISNVSLTKLTGNVIGNIPVLGFSFFGFALLIIGIVLFLMDQEGALEKTLAQEIKESRRIVEKPREIIHIAKKSGYLIGDEVREGTPIYNQYGNRITVVPRHNLSSGVSRNIINDLARGESSFRKRNY
jgi:hypothetical protein